MMRQPIRPLLSLKVGCPALDAYIDRAKLNELLTTPSLLTLGNWRMVYGVLSFAHWLRQSNFV